MANKVVYISCCLQPAVMGIILMNTRDHLRVRCVLTSATMSVCCQHARLPHTDDIENLTKILKTQKKTDKRIRLKEFGNCVHRDRFIAVQ